VKYSARVFWPGALLLLLALPARAADFGLLATGDLSFTGKGPADAVFAWNGSISPWFSTFVGDKGELFISAAATGTLENLEYAIAPELLRADLALRFDGGSSLRLGRMEYRDPLGFVAEGLFDGARFSQMIGGGSLYAGAWYTGLQYKKTANITMNGGDTLEYFNALDYGDFYNTYFASKRALAAVGAEHPALGGFMGVRTAVIGQFDLNRLDDVRTSRVHSQYLTGKASVPVGSRLVLEGGGALELAEITGGDYGGAVSLSGAAEAGFTFFMSPAIRDRFTVTGRFASGGEDGAPYGAFSPVTTEPQGYILQAKLSGLSLVRAEYAARLHETFAVNVSTAFFFKDEGRDYIHRHFAVEGGYFLGNETYARLSWNPFSDVNLRVEAGAFIPRSESDPVWKAGIGVTVVLH
jgi:hypothetical protein